MAPEILLISVATKNTIDNTKPAIAFPLLYELSPLALKIIPIIVTGKPINGINHAIIEHNPNISPIVAF